MEMGMVEALAGGGITGILGLLLTAFFDQWKRQKDQKHELDLKKLEIKEDYLAERRMRRLQLETPTESDAARFLADAEVQKEEIKADVTLRKESYKLDKPAWAVGEHAHNPWFLTLDFIRGMIRPALTAYLAWMTTAMYQDFLDLLAKHGDKLNMQQLFQLIEMLTITIVYLTATTVTWWFGTRMKGADLDIFKRGKVK